jgi:hypothetical protein
MRKTTPAVPAMKEPKAAIPKARPALPCLAIWYPSIQVTTLQGSPGMFTNIEVVDPPYIPPYQMPANIMMAVTAGRSKVKGSKRAIQPAVPMPGRTPMRVPKKTPTKQ